MLDKLLSMPTLLLIVAFLIYLITVKRLNSFSFALGWLIVLEVVHQLIRHGVALVAANDSGYTSFFVWYLSFSATDFLYVVAVYFTVKKQNLAFDLSTKFICSVMIVLGLLQLLRMLDRLLFDSPLAITLYTKGVPFLNLSLSLVIIFVVIISFFNAKRPDH